VTKQSPYAVAWVQFFLANEPYFRGDRETVLAELNRLAQTVDSRSGREREAFANFACLGYLRFGRLKAAEEFARKISPEDNRYFDLALVALSRNDKDILKDNLVEHLRSRQKDRIDALPILIRAGLLAEAQKLISNPALKGEGFVAVSQGELALGKGQTAQAILLLHQGTRSLQSGETTFLYAGSESLAVAYERRGDFLSSLRVLEERARDDEKTIGSPARILWLRIKVRLTQLYRKLNRVEDAQRVEAELLRLLAYADADHPILRQLKNLASPGANQLRE
jgi:hypothetical protein